MAGKTRRQSNENIETRLAKINTFSENPVRALMAVPGGQVMTVGSHTLVPFTVVREDSHGAMSGGIFTCPAGKGGLYAIGAQIAMNDSGVGFSSYIEGNLLINNASQILSLIGWVAGTPYPAYYVTPIYKKLKPGDQVKLTNFQSAGSARVYHDAFCFLSICQMTQDDVGE